MKAYLLFMRPVIILHHHEIILKGENRHVFEKQLTRNIRRACGSLIPPQGIYPGYGRSIIRLDGSADAAASRLESVFGIANVCVGVEVEQNIDVLTNVAAQMLEGRTFKTIKVDTRRVDKSFPIRSMEVNAHIGAHLCERFQVRANLTQPDETIAVEIVDGSAFMYRDKRKGAGGIPVGVSGKVISLLSAGFDSPVASWQMMKRGCVVDFVHFHSMPYVGRQSVDQVEMLAHLLTQWQYASKLHLIPFAGVQQEIVLKTPQHLRVVLYRRMMIRIAEEIARREKAEALVTGEAVGQVASQTLRNIRVINEVAQLPILRPLSGADKEETMALARRIGTYDISKEPYDDCCSFLAPRKPETWADPSEVHEAESKLDIQQLVAMALEKVTLQRYQFPPAFHAEPLQSAEV